MPASASSQVPAHISVRNPQKDISINSPSHATIRRFFGTNPDVAGPGGYTDDDAELGGIPIGCGLLPPGWFEAVGSGE